MKPSFLPFNEPNLCNAYIFIDLEHNDWFCFHNQVGLNTDLLDKHSFKEGCYATNRKTKECRPTQTEVEENNEQKEITPQKQEIQECKYATT